MSDVVSQGKEKQDDGVGHCHSKSASKCAPKPSQRQDGQCGRKENIEGIERLLGQIATVKAPEVGPEVNCSPQRHPDKPAAVAVDELSGLMLLARHVTKLAEREELLPLCFAGRRMNPGRSPMPTDAIVSHIKLEAEIISEKNGLVEGAIVADEPGRDESG